MQQDEVQKRCWGENVFFMEKRHRTDLLLNSSAALEVVTDVSPPPQQMSQQISPNETEAAANSNRTMQKCLIIWAYGAGLAVKRFIWDTFWNNNCHSNAKIIELWVFSERLLMVPAGRTETDAFNTDPVAFWLIFMCTYFTPHWFLQ